jgi:DNA-binding MarR family transcriptional regulator
MSVDQIEIHPGSTLEDSRALTFIRTQGFYGTNFDELGQYLGVHHGSSSAILSKLHDDGAILRLAEQRRGKSVYVTPEYQDRRKTVPRRKNLDEQALREKIAAELDDYGFYAAAGLVRGPDA